MDRRHVLVGLASTVAVAGCSSLGGESDDGDGPDDSDGADGEAGGDGSDGGDGGDGREGSDGNGGRDGSDDQTDEPTEPTETDAGTRTPTATATPGGGDGPGGEAAVRTAAPDDGRDWDAIAGHEEVSGFDLPDGAPTAFGFTRVSSDNTMTVSYGSMSGSDPAERGTVYALFVVDGSVEGIVVWETPIEDGDEFTVGPDDSVLPMDVGSITNLVVAWEGSSDLYVVDRNGDILG